MIAGDAVVNPVVYKDTSVRHPVSACNNRMLVEHGGIDRQGAHLYGRVLPESFYPIEGHLLLLGTAVLEITDRYGCDNAGQRRQQRNGTYFETDPQACRLWKVRPRSDRLHEGETPRMRIVVILFLVAIIASLASALVFLFRDQDRDSLSLIHISEPTRPY